MSYVVYLDRKWGVIWNSVMETGGAPLFLVIPRKQDLHEGHRYVATTEDHTQRNILLFNLFKEVYFLFHRHGKYFWE